MAVKIEKETIIGDVLDIAPHISHTAIWFYKATASHKPRGKIGNLHSCLQKRCHPAGGMAVVIKPCLPDQLRKLPGND